MAVSTLAELSSSPPHDCIYKISLMNPNVIKAFFFFLRKLNRKLQKPRFDLAESFPLTNRCSLFSWVSFVAFFFG